jgi:hypothetical protein
MHPHHWPIQLTSDDSIRRPLVDECRPNFKTLTGKRIATADTLFQENYCLFSCLKLLIEVLHSQRPAWRCPSSFEGQVLFGAAYHMSIHAHRKARNAIPSCQSCHARCPRSSAVSYTAVHRLVREDGPDKFCFSQRQLNSLVIRHKQESFVSTHPCS